MISLRPLTSCTYHNLQLPIYVSADSLHNQTAFSMEEGPLLFCSPVRTRAQHIPPQRMCTMNSRMKLHCCPTAHRAPLLTRTAPAPWPCPMPPLPSCAQSFQAVLPVRAQFSLPEPHTRTWMCSCLFDLGLCSPPSHLLSPPLTI